MRLTIQFVRYSAVGLATNVIGYLGYLALTHLGMGYKLAMSLLYAVGMLQSFVFNKKWSFRFDGAASPALMRYATAYAVGYVIQFLALILLVDQMGLPHQWVMGLMIVVVAMVLFLAQRFWVFPKVTRSPTA